jgi:predicted RNA-binding Zn ribbon-like protein
MRQMTYADRPEEPEAPGVPPVGHDGTRLPHGHQVPLEVGLAFINTHEFKRTGTVEHLPTVDVALVWLREHSLLHADAQEAEAARLAGDPAEAARVLGRIHRLRGAMRELADASVERRAPDEKQLERVNRALRTPYTYVLVPSPDGVSLDHRHVGDPVEGALARLAESIARELSTGHPDRLRICANDECRWVFQDTSRTGRRKWCDMSTCGNRAKVARHRERQRAGRAGSDGPDGSPTAGADDEAGG